MFYGREDELAELNRRYDSEGFQFVPVYGRRRVGKTALIDEFIKDKAAVKFTAVKGSYSTNMRLLSSIVLGVKNAPPMNFEDILEAMHSRFGGKRYVFAIDEYPYLVRSDESVTGILNNFIESHLDSQVFIILSGSSMNIMKNQILGKKSPLYGRRTGQIKLSPFPFSETGPFLSNYSDEERMTVYGLVGGIPWYLSFFDDRKSLKENIIDNLINPYAVLNKEATLLFAEEFESPVAYYDVISSIAKGHNRVGEIAADSGLETSRISVLLKELIILEIIEKVRPIDDPKSKRTLYRIKDHYLRSYFKFIYPENVEVSRYHYDDVYNEMMEGMDTYLGHIFEDVCSEYIGRTCREVGTWWGTDPSTRRKEEIDIAALNKGHMVLCECKYQSEPADKDVIQTLIRRAGLVKSNLPKELFVFSRSWYTEEAIELARTKDVALRSLKDVSHPE
ncbi:MAG: ATP-binding protein [Candidatus Methanomethylophilaceae archaeon]|nr:ATP-binding protein [Candidatus Methanomethylophilaceae archaeon]